MGLDAHFQAIPEDCELLARARVDSDIADLMQYFNSFATGQSVWRLKWEHAPPEEIYFDKAVRDLIVMHSGLVNRYAYSKSRTHDQIIYLLSPGRRIGQFHDDPSLVRKAFRGFQRLHPTVTAAQGFPIGFVPAVNVHQVADFFDTVSFAQLHQHYDPIQMTEMGIYKMYIGAGEEYFNYIWTDFSAIRQLYREAATYHEAVITVIN